MRFKAPVFFLLTLSVLLLARPAFATVVDSDEEPAGWGKNSALELKTQTRAEKVPMATDADETTDRPERPTPSFNGMSRCEVLKNRIHFHTQNKETHNKHYQFVIERLTQLAEMFAEKGYNTEKLVAAIAELGGMVDEYLMLMDDLIAKLTELETFVCSDDAVDVADAAAFREGLVEASKILEQARDQRVAIRAYYTDVIRALIVELRLEVANDQTRTD